MDHPVEISPAKTKLEPRNVRSKRRIVKRARKFRKIVKRRAENAKNEYIRLIIRPFDKVGNSRIIVFHVQVMLNFSQCRKPINRN